MGNFTKHLQHYLPLLGLFVAAILGFIAFSYDKSFQMAIIVATAFGYMSWGMVHHYIHRDLHPSVIIEYVVIALMGIVLVFSILFRS